MLKGHTKIELKNEKTGEIQVVEKDNMITNAIQDALVNESFSGSNKLTALAYTQYHKIAIDLFGGILLWEKQLTANPSEYELPEDNKCIGYTAYNISNSGINTKLGSYNMSESGLQNDGSYKHVFDFSTAQANGEISAISLTNCVMGKFGINETPDLIEESQCYTSNNRNPTLYHPNDTYFNYAISIPNGPNKLLPVCIKDEYIYSLVLSNIYKYTGYTDKYIGNNGNKLILGKTKLNKNKLHLTVDINGSEALNVTEFIEIQMPDNFDISLFPNNSGTLNYSQGVIGLGSIILNENNLYLTLSNKQMTKTCQVINININDLSCTVTKIVTPFNIYFSYIIYIYGSHVSYVPYELISGICIKNKLLLIEVNTYKVYWVDLNNPTVFNTLYTDSNYTKVGIPYNNLLLIQKGDEVQLLQFTTDTINIIYMQIKVSGLDSSLDIYNSLLSSNVDKVSSFITSNDNKIFKISSTTNMSYLTEIQPPFFLTTKNNLDTPVTKTSEQSMKITYTLTEES